MIKNFDNRTLFPEYDEHKERVLSVLDTLPEVVSWESEGKAYRLENKNKIISELLENDDLIAIIEAPFIKQFNKAYIINGRSEVVMDISKVFREQYSQHNAASFVDLYCIHKKLFYFMVFNGSDFRVEIDTKSFLLGKLTESK